MAKSSHLRVVYFFGGRSPQSRLAFDLAAARRPDYAWRFLALLTAQDRAAFREEQHAPAAILSFLNPCILEPWLLERAPAFNVHPGTPDFPGRDPWHFARYEGRREIGATLHRMTARVDAGEILDVLELEADPALPVAAMRETSMRAAIELLLRNLDAILDNRIHPRCQRSWRAGAKRSRKDFVAMCEIDPRMGDAEVARRIDAFHVPGYQNLYMRVGGQVFVYSPGDARSLAAAAASATGTPDKPRERLESGIEVRRGQPANQPAKQTRVA